jgi:hypothetical protein
VLQTNMTKPPTSVRSIRLPDTLWEKLARRAAETGQTVNALMTCGAELAVTVLIHRSDLENDSSAELLAKACAGFRAPAATGDYGSMVTVNLGPTKTVQLAKEGDAPAASPLGIAAVKSEPMIHDGKPVSYMGEPLHVDVPFGPVRPKPGTRQKGGKK